MAAKKQEEEFSKPQPVPAIEGPTVENANVKPCPIEMKKRKRRKKNPITEGKSAPHSEVKPYNLRDRKQIDYKEKDRQKINLLEETKKIDDRKSLIEDEEKKYFSHLKEYWETRSYQTIELDPKLVGRFSNQTREARWHDECVVIYTDAACTGNGTKECKAAYAIYLNNESPYNRQKCIENKNKYLSSGILTNNREEIIGVIKALTLSKQYNLNKVEIHTDSKWIVDYFRLFRSLRLRELSLIHI